MKTAVPAVLVFQAFSVCCFGQLATIQGEIRDPSNAVIPAGAIKVTNVTTGVTQSSATNATGFYSVPNLIPGRYAVGPRRSDSKRLSARTSRLT